MSTIPTKDEAPPRIERLKVQNFRALRSTGLQAVAGMSSMVSTSPLIAGYEAIVRRF